MTTTEKTASVAKALSHPVRVQIVDAADAPAGARIATDMLREDR